MLFRSDKVLPHTVAVPPCDDQIRVFRSHTAQTDPGRPVNILFHPDTSVHSGGHPVNDPACYHPAALETLPFPAVTCLPTYPLQETQTTTYDSSGFPFLPLLLSHASIFSHFRLLMLLPSHASVFSHFRLLTLLPSHSSVFSCFCLLTLPSSCASAFSRFCLLTFPSSHASVFSRFSALTAARRYSKSRLSFAARTSRIIPAKKD